MRLSAVLAAAALLWSDAAAAAHLRPRSYDSHDYYALHLDSGTPPSMVAASLGLDYDGPLGELQDHHMFSSPRGPTDVVKEALRRRRRRHVNAGPDALDGILFAQKQKPKPRIEKRLVPPPPPPRAQAGLRTGPIAAAAAPEADDAAVLEQFELAKALGIADPIFTEQWHLFNTVQVGNDVNVSDVWLQGITGQNATVAIVDDGLDMYSDDLKDNYFAEGSYDFNDGVLEPRPRLDDDKHGTRCAGEIAAVKNHVCGVGVAWDAKVAGIRILSKQISDADEAVAMTYAFQKNQIYSCSWGPPDDGQAMDAPGILIKRAMLNGVQNGRGRRGSIYVFASGNGANNGDNCNYDGYTNSIYSITVGAVDRKGQHPYYSERCCAQLVVTYSSGSGDAIHTTDVGTDKCYSNHGGTSAAAPLAAGVFALVLSVRPELTWRDLQYLTLQTAVTFDDEGGEWQTTSIGKRFSHKFGYGKLDAYAIVEAAKVFEPVKPQAWYRSPWMHVRQPIPQGEVGLASTLEVTAEELGEANFARVEHVTVTMNAEHQVRGEISVELRSPEGVVSHLSRRRKKDRAVTGYTDWTFMSVVHWRVPGESGIGEWTVVVKDGEVNENSGSLTDWRLTLWGECVDADAAEPLPMPTEHDDDDHDATTTVVATTTSIGEEEPATTVHVVPTDHPDRPVNEKPDGDGDGDGDGATATSPATSDATATATATATEGPQPLPTSDLEHFLPSFFPTFGVSKRTQIWIYGAVAIIVLFCAGLGAYFALARRRRLRNSAREDYEFEMLEDADDREAMLGGASGGRRARKRAGELYDAFAGESDEELFSEDDDEDDDQEADAAEAYRDKDDGGGEGEEGGREPDEKADR
ncbi:MAG: pheromone processing endoprotease [Thelocarpon impressellum]|nr:MAG: pheromone processing endoprotease [Thelocarpon impressellum]